MKQAIKKIRQIAASALPKRKLNGLPGMTRKASLTVLTYHRILPLNDDRVQYEQPGMYVTPATFKQHLQWLQEHFSIMRLSDWLSAAQHQQALPKHACAITFDDGWLDNYEFAFPALKAAQVPATIFVVENMINSDSDFWPGRLAKLIFAISQTQPQRWPDPQLDWLRALAPNFSFGSTPPDTYQLNEIILACKQYSDQEMHQRIDDCCQSLQLDISRGNRVLLNHDEINEMLISGIIDIGSHTSNHIRMLPNMSADVMQQEVVASQTKLTSRFATEIKTFCYPNGDVTEPALDLVAKHYMGACTTARGINFSNSNLHLIKRFSIHEAMTNTRTAFLAKISGWI